MYAEFVFYPMDQAEYRDEVFDYIKSSYQSNSCMESLFDYMMDFVDSTSKTSNKELNWLFNDGIAILEVWKLAAEKDDRTVDYFDNCFRNPENNSTVHATRDLKTIEFSKGKFDKVRYLDGKRWREIPYEQFIRESQLDAFEKDGVIAFMYKDENAGHYACIDRLTTGYVNEYRYNRRTDIE